jgi:hypothetical protein
MVSSNIPAVFNFWLWQVMQYRFKTVWYGEADCEAGLANPADCKEPAQASTIPTEQRTALSIARNLSDSLSRSLSDGALQNRSWPRKRIWLPDDPAIRFLYFPGQAIAAASRFCTHPSIIEAENIVFTDHHFRDNPLLARIQPVSFGNRVSRFRR